MQSSPMRALVVDDSRSMRMILAHILGQLGYQVDQAGNGRQALEVLDRERNEISLVLVDWNMPEMNGLDFLRALRANPRYAQVTVVMVTTETQASQMIAALEAGANEYIMKPFTPEVISEKLRLLGLAA